MCGNDQQQSSLRDQFRSMDYWAMLLCRSMALPAEVFLRHGFGRDYMGMHAGIALLLLLLWPALMPEFNPLGHFLFIPAFLFMCGWTNVTGAIRRRRGYACHSRYTGTPRLMWVFRTWNEVSVKKWIEPTVVILAGALLLYVSVPLGMFFLASSVAMTNCIATDLAQEQSRAQDMLDSYLEQQVIADRFRQMRGDATGVRSGHEVGSSKSKIR